MAKGCKLKKIYSDANHELKISGDSTFYNHTTEGQTFGRNFNINRYGEGVTALDSWLTLGQVSLSKPSGKTYFGVLKSQDRNGSLVGGANNDGGSEMIAEGLLINNDAVAGIPLTSFDGLDTMAVLPNTWIENGFDDGFGSAFNNIEKDMDRFKVDPSHGDVHSQSFSSSSSSQMGEDGKMHRMN